MIESVQIKNFRCFEEHSIRDFGTVNIVVGDNGSGKTALLEALFLSQSGHPEIIGRLRTWRGFGGMLAVSRTRGSYESIWKDLFFNWDQERTIEITTVGSPENARSLKILYNPVDSFTIPQPQPLVVGSQKTDSATIIPITFTSTLQDTTEQPRVFKPLIHSEGISWGGLAPPSLVAFFASSFLVVVSPSEVANQFSELSKHRKEKRFSKVIRAVYPQIKSLGIESEMGQPMLFGDIMGLPMKIPLVLQSSGTSKLVAILLGISSQANGLILIDEIENGFYYKTMPMVWETLLAFCSEYSVQIVASTHSKECLIAARGTIKKHGRKFRLIRMEHKGNRRISRVFSGSEFDAAIETGVEFR